MSFSTQEPAFSRSLVLFTIVAAFAFPFVGGCGSVTSNQSGDRELINEYVYKGAVQFIEARPNFPKITRYKTTWQGSYCIAESEQALITLSQLEIIFDRPKDFAEAAMAFKWKPFIASVFNPQYRASLTDTNSSPPVIALLDESNKLGFAARPFLIEHPTYHARYTEVENWPNTTLEYFGESREPRFETCVEIEVSEMNSGVSFKMFFDKQRENLCVYLAQYDGGRLVNTWESKFYKDGLVAIDLHYFDAGQKKLHSRVIVTGLSSELSESDLKEKCRLPYYGLDEPSNMARPTNRKYFWIAGGVVCLAAFVTLLRSVSWSKV